MKEPTARIRIYLKGTRPEIWWRLDVPLSASLLLLHDLIQIAIGWADGAVVKTKILRLLKSFGKRWRLSAILPHALR